MSADDGGAVRGTGEEPGGKGATAAPGSQRSELATHGSASKRQEKKSSKSSSDPHEFLASKSSSLLPAAEKMRLDTAHAGVPKDFPVDVPSKSGGGGPAEGGTTAPSGDVPGGPMQYSHSGRKSGEQSSLQLA